MPLPRRSLDLSSFYFVVEQNFAFISYKTLLLILYYTSKVKSENFRGGRAGFIGNDQGDPFSFALRWQLLKKLFIRQGGFPSAPSGYIPDEIKSFNSRFLNEYIKNNIGIHTSEQ